MTLQPPPAAAELARPAWQAPDAPLAVYLHIPFCATRCSYCAFNTYTGRRDEYEPYVAALRREIAWVGEGAPTAACTLYFGGGTPSLLAPSQIGAVIAAAQADLRLAPDAEITLEANPGSVNAAYLAAVRRAGANRLSLGMQSSDPAELRRFARRHTLADVHDAVTWARAAGFASVSLDLIYGVPGQTPDSWRRSVEAALDLAPDHLSLYSLGVEEGTAFARWIARGELPPPDPDLAADMYEWASERLEAAGLHQYEISNWAAPGHACQHNVHVWRNLPYLGLGAGAHGGAAGVRTVAALRPDVYIARLAAPHDPLPFPLTPATDEVERLTREDALAETMFLGLRLTDEGIAPESLRARFGVDPRAVFGRELDRLHALSLLRTAADGRILLTPRARLIANRVFEAFV